MFTFDVLPVVFAPEEIVPTFTGISPTTFGEGGGTQGSAPLLGGSQRKGDDCLRYGARYPPAAIVRN